jgi:hypothetical protein
MTPTPEEKLAMNQQLTQAKTQLEGMRKRVPTPTVQPSVTATDLATPPPTPQPPVPTTPTVPDRTKQIVSHVARDTQGFITAQTEEAAKARELAETYGALGDQGSLADLMKQQRQELGIDTNLKELKDIQLQLTDMDTASALTKTQIEGAAGQTIGQAQREVTQEDRENAVRTSGLAARAAVLQGNINTATQLAKDTVDLAFKDRQLEAENLLNQINYYQGIVDDQTAQLLEEDKRQYEAELSRIEELKTNIANAMVNGASQAEIAQLNDPTVDDATKLSMAQQITARGMNQIRNLEIAQMNASIANTYDQIASRAEQNKALLGTLNGKTQTETERLTEGYANRMAEADAIVGQLGEQFAKPESFFGQLAPNVLKSEDRQKFEQAQRNFINAVLRRESGAVISDEEFTNARLQYFPQPGDSAGALQQKAQNRRGVVANMYSTANVPMPEYQAPQGTTPLAPGTSGVLSSGLSFTIEQ